MRRTIARSLVLFIAIAALSGCQAFFTTSLAAGLARDSVKVPDNISNEDAAALLAGNPSEEMLAGLLVVLNEQALAGNTGSAALAAEAAISVSGVSDTIMGTVAEVIATSEIPSDLSAFVAALEDGFGAAGVSTALLALDDPAVVAQLEPTELVIAAVLLAGSRLTDHGVDVNDPNADPAALADYQADPAVALALSLANEAAADIVAAGGDPQLAEMLASFLPMEQP